MSEQLESTEDRPLVAPPTRHRRDRRSWWPFVAVGIALAVVAGAVVVLVAHRSPARRSAGPIAPVATAGPSHSPRAATTPAPSPATAARALLQRRAAAVLTGNRAAFMSTVDPTNAAFRARQAAMFANLAHVPLHNWSYRLGAGARTVGATVAASYAAPVWAPSDLELSYELTGFDPAPTELREYPTFVARAGHWYLGSLSNFAARGEASDTALWDYGPVRAVRRGRVLVLGPPGELSTMRDVARRASAAIPRVTAVWGRKWARRVVVQVPASQQEMGRIDDDPGDLSQIAALTSAEIRTARGRPAPVGDRITINPRTWATLSGVGRSDVLTHELTHVASRADTGAQMPTWLVEGLAEYVEFRTSPAPPRLIAAELTAALQHGSRSAHGSAHRGRTLDQLPTPQDFRGSSPHLAVAYEEAWLACRYIGHRYGVARLVSFYRAVGTSRAPTRAAVAHGLRQVLGLRPAQLVTGWRAYVGQQLR